MKTSLHGLAMALASSNDAPLVQSSPIQINAYLQARASSSNDVDANAAQARDQDLGGATLDHARVSLDGRVNEKLRAFLSIDGGDAALVDLAGTVTGVRVIDAFADVTLCEFALMRVGQFSSTVLASSGIDESELVFLDRSFLGEAWDNRDTGVEFSGAIDRFSWWLAAQDGSDGAGSEYALSARVALQSFGRSSTFPRESVLAADEASAQVGLGWFDDAAIDDNSAVVADATLATQRFFGSFEIADYDDGARPASTLQTTTGVLIPAAAAAVGSETPWNVTLGARVVVRLDAALRWQDFDDDDDTSVAGASLAWRACEGVRVILQGNWIESDMGALDGNSLALGLGVQL